MRTAIALTLALAVATPATAGLSFQVNPFGVPAVGTGIGIYAETSGTEAVFAQQWIASGNIVNNDAPVAGAGGLLSPQNPPPMVQRQNDALIANVTDPGISTQWEADDSYWGDFFTTHVLGAGYNGTGGANPGGAAATTMELVGGTTFGVNPAPSELVLYAVIDSTIIVTGELAIGASTLESYDFYLTPNGSAFGLFGGRSCSRRDPMS